jgi:hypothetical protein
MTSREAGLKADETRRAKFGPDEQKRAKRQADWTKQYGSSAENPHTRQNVYSAADLDRGRRFDAWRKANADRNVWENPFCHSTKASGQDPAT